MGELADYKITFTRNPLLGMWSWKVTTPSGDTLGPFNWGSVTKEDAERQALRRIEIHRATETLSGDELAERVRART